MAEIASAPPTAAARLPTRVRWLVAPLLALVAAVTALSFGRYPLPTWETMHFLLAAAGLASMEPERYALLHNLIVEIRLPRVLAAILVGAALAVSGAAYQALFRNPLVSPGILGVLAGASAGAALGIVMDGNWLFVQASAFVMGLAAVGIGVGIAHLFGGGSIIMLILGGIINVVTKRGGPEHFGGSLRMGHGSYDASRAGVDINGQVNDFDYVLGYEYGTVRRDYKDGDGDRVHNTKTDGTRRLNFDLGYTFNERHRIGIDGYRYSVDKAHRPSYVDEDGEIRSASYTDRKTELFHLNYEGATRGGRFSWKANAGRGTDIYETYQAGSRYPKGQEVDSDRAQGSLTYASERFDLTGGVDYIKYDVENSSTARGAALAPPCTHALADPDWCGLGYPMHPTSTTTLWGAYLVGTLKLRDGALNLSGGLRYEHASAKDLSVGDEHYDKIPALTNYFGGLTRDDLPTRRSFNHVSPTLGATWLPMDWLKLRANYTQGWRAPSGRQLFASSIYEDYGAPGDPRLKPELTDAYEIGFDMARDDWRLSSTYFYYKVKDNVFIYPGFLPDGSGPYGRVLLNVDKRSQEGVEIQASANVAGLFGRRDLELRPYVNVTHMIRKEEVLVEGAPGLAGKWWPITRMPDTVMNYGVRFNHPAWKFSGNLNFNYYGKQYGGRADVGAGPLPAFGRFTVANLSLRKRLWDSGKANSLDLKMDLNNLFDKTYSYLGRVPDDAYAYPGRNFHVTLIYNF